VAHLLESFGALDKLQGFASTLGRRFYNRELKAEQTQNIVLRKIGGQVIEEKYETGESSAVPFWAGKEISWKIVSS
jgi:dihydroorotase